MAKKMVVKAVQLKRHITRVLEIRRRTTDSKASGMKKYCAQCGLECENEYYTCLDNFLQVKYFDDDSCNIFCSEECFCKALSLELMFIENKENKNE